MFCKKHGLTKNFCNKIESQTSANRETAIIILFLGYLRIGLCDSRSVRLGLRVVRTALAG